VESKGTFCVKHSVIWSRDATFELWKRIVHFDSSL
jgi:hypothetical protein